MLGASTGIVIAMNGQHWVGDSVSDAGGLPTFGWSRDGGDLRVAHFFGVHAIQILPLFALAADQVAPTRAKAAVTAAVVALVVLTLTTTLQALAGKPFLPMFG